MWCLSIIWISSPSLKRAILGDEGGKGIIFERAASVASLSTPAKTVASWSGVFSFERDFITPGLALAAAHPQIEFTTTKVVPSLESTSSTSWGRTYFKWV